MLVNISYLFHHQCVFYTCSLYTCMRALLFTLKNYALTWVRERQKSRITTQLLSEHSEECSYHFPRWESVAKEQGRVEGKYGGSDFRNLNFYNGVIQLAESDIQVRDSGWRNKFGSDHIIDIQSQLHSSFPLTFSKTSFLHCSSSLLSHWFFPHYRISFIILQTCAISSHWTHVSFQSLPHFSSSTLMEKLEKIV